MMRSYDHKRIVVAGGSGFLGSRIVNRLYNYNCDVFIPSRKDGLDFTKSTDCLQYLGEVRPDIVFNCAAHQGGIKYQKGREGTIYLDNLLMGTFLMDAACKSNVKKYINVVAGCSYPGYLTDEVMDEAVYWNGPLHESVLNYGFTKKAQVVQGWTFAKQYDFNSIHLLLANMYGPGDHFEPDRSHGLAALIMKFYVAKKSNLASVEIWGTGRPIREWLYVEDAAEGIIRAGDKYNEVDPMNIAVGSGLSISELADLISKILDYKGSLVYKTDMPDGAMKKVLGISRMKAKLNWTPPTSLEIGIKKTVDWLDANYDKINERR